MTRIEIIRAFKPQRHGAPIPHTPTVIFRVTALKRAHLAYQGGVEQLQVQDNNGCLPIHWAAGDNESPEVVQKLLEQGGVE